MSNDLKMVVGILGAGRIGKLHATNISRMPNVELKRIVDPFADEAMNTWAKSVGIAEVSKNPDDIFSDPEINAVIICSSTDTHADFIIAAAQAGKHVFCEKPIDLNIEKIKTALAEVEKAGVKLQVGFVRRFDHNHARVQELVATGKVGTPHIIKVTSRDPERPPLAYVKVSGGIFMDMMIHDFDMARFLAGSDVEEVYAVGKVLVDESFAECNDVDTAIVTLKFANGAIGVIDNSRETLYGYDQRTEVFGNKGCAIAANDTPSTTILINPDGISGDRPVWFFLERYNDAFIKEVAGFFDCIRNDSEPVVTGFDGLRAVQIAMAAQRSLESGKAVQISEFD